VKRVLFSILGIVMTVLLCSAPALAQEEPGQKDPDALTATKTVDEAIAEPGTNPWYMTPAGITMALLAAGVLAFLIGAAIRRGGKDPEVPRSMRTRR
jgi:hypothetical protein